MNKMKLLLVMIIWGSLGVFTRSIPLSALNLAFLRALIALPVLFVAMRAKKPQQVTLKLMKPYIISGVLLGIGWLTLFYGFKNTSIATAVIIYNMCPVYVMIAAPLVLKEKTSRIQVAVISVSFVGLFFIVGSNLTTGHGYLGMALSAVSGMCYAVIVLINRNIKERIENRQATFIQITVAMLVLLPFVVSEGTIGNVLVLNIMQIGYTVLLGVLHTGVAYTLFFSLYEHMKSIEIVSYSYFEPLFGVFMGVVFIGEQVTLWQVMGGGLILGSTYLGELFKTKVALQNKENALD